MRKRSPTTIADDVDCYIWTGETDSHHAAWPVNGFMDRANRAHDDFRDALVREVRRLAEELAYEPLSQANTVALTRAKVEPMVCGLFPRVEQDAGLRTLQKSVAFLTSANIEPILIEHGCDSSAWTLANLYLASFGAKLLGDDAPRLLGLSEATTCCASPDHFAEDDPFADMIVDETAHIYHRRCPPRWCATGWASRLHRAGPAPTPSRT